MISSQDNAGRRRRYLVLCLKIILAFGVLAWLCTGRLDLSKILEAPLSFELFAFGALLFASMLLPAVRWWWLLRIQQIDAPLWQAIQLSWVGYLTALILPGAASGDLAKSWMIVRRQPTARARSLSTVIVDRVVGLYSLVLLAAASAAWVLSTGPIEGPVAGMAAAVFLLLVGATVGAMVMLLGPWKRVLWRFVPAEWFEAWRESYQLYWQSKRALAGCLALSLISSMLTALSFGAADRVFGGNVGWSASLLTGPLVVLANCLPLTPGGVGVAEATASELFAQFGAANGAEMMLSVRLMMAALSLPALFALFSRQQNRISSIPQPISESAGMESPNTTHPGQSRAA